MQKKQPSMYDQTKKMLNTLRNLNESKFSSRTLSEQVETQSQPPMGDEENTTQQQGKDFVVVNDVEVKMLSSDESDLELTDEQKEIISGLIDNFKQQVSQIVEFTPGMTINPNQIRLDGKLTDEDVNFVLIAGEDSGTFINAEMLKLENNVLSPCIVNLQLSGKGPCILKLKGVLIQINPLGLRILSNSSTALNGLFVCSKTSVQKIISNVLFGIILSFF
jgi:hypothetical protein